MSIKFSKIRKVKTPKREVKISAGITFFIPVFNKSFEQDLLKKNNGTRVSLDPYKNEIILKRGFKITIPSGICVDVPENYIFVAFNKPHIFKDQAIDIFSEIIDNNYKREINFVIQNNSYDRAIIKENQEIIQFILIPNIVEDFKEVPLEEIYEISKLN